jgi:hypothetical protein
MIHLGILVWYEGLFPVELVVGLKIPSGDKSLFPTCN